jgi:glycosyltransferase involved in cell wall biosynthesis
MPKLSVVIITFNEERNIGRCIGSVREVADEIVVVDSFSTDKTREICEKSGVKFIEHAFEGHIQQKNFAITQAKFPHQLSLDADEALSEDLKTEMLRIKNDWKFDGYRINRLTNYCGKWIHHCGWYPDTKLRLYDSAKGRWGGVNPHDKFELNPGSKVGFLKGDILHYSYYSVEEHIRQADKFSTIAAKELIGLGKSVSYFQIIINPVAKFIRNYILRLGFLDGFYGFIICRIAAHETFQKYSKARQIRHSIK